MTHPRWALSAVPVRVIRVDSGFWSIANLLPRAPLAPKVANVAPKAADVVAEAKRCARR
jgi:hypothetical protein